MAKLAGLFVAVGWAATIGTRYARNPSAADPQVPTRPGNQRVTPEEPPDPVRLWTMSARGITPGHLLDGDFTIVKRMRDIPGSCRNILDSSFVTFSGAPAPAKQVIFADPGEDFEATDALRGGLPFRRLVLAGLGSNTCFVYYENGGRMYPSSCLAVIDYNEKKATWVGEFRRKVGELSRLRRMLRGNQFSDTAGPAC
jgi:hypothetical protein